MRNLFKYASLIAVAICTVIFAFLPLGITFITSFTTQNGNCLFTLSNYWALFNPTYLRIFLNSLILATECTVLCLVIGYPFAFFIARSQSRFKPLLLLLVVIPSWTSSLIRTYAIMIILKAKGLLNTFLLTLGLIHEPLQLLYSQTAVLVGSVYDLLPFMILPLYTNIEKLNPEYLEAARDLGAHWFTTLVKIILPLTISGIISGSVLVFLPAMTMFYIPVLLGGAKNLLVGNLIEYQFLSANNWPFGTAISIVIIFLMCLLIYFYRSHSTKEHNLTCGEDGL